MSRTPSVMSSNGRVTGKGTESLAGSARACGKASLLGEGLVIFGAETLGLFETQGGFQGLGRLLAGRTGKAVGFNRDSPCGKIRTSL